MHGSPRFRPRRSALLWLLGVAVGVLAAGCGGKIEVPKDQPVTRRGAELFNQRCSGCHTFDAANAYGSKPEGQKQGGERTNGPDFNLRKVKRPDVLFAIRNGGFSGSIMPANVVVGQDAQAVADFVSQYSGRKKGAGKENQSQPQTR